MHQQRRQRRTGQQRLEVVGPRKAAKTRNANSAAAEPYTKRSLDLAAFVRATGRRIAG
jgi:hypothetical protein